MKLRELVQRCAILGIPNQLLGFDSKRHIAACMIAIGKTYGPIWTTIPDYDAVMTALLNKWKSVKI